MDPALEDALPGGNSSLPGEEVVIDDPAAPDGSANDNVWGEAADPGSTSDTGSSSFGGTNGYDPMANTGIAHLELDGRFAGDLHQEGSLEDVYETRFRLEAGVEFRRSRRLRISVGVLAEVERHSFELRVATLEEALAASGVERARRALELSRLLGEAASTDLQAVTLPRDFEPLPPNLTTLAQATSPQLAELQAEVEVAQNTVARTHDARRPRLDVEASLSQQGLGNQRLEVGDARVVRA